MNFAPFTVPPYRSLPPNPFSPARSAFSPQPIGSSIVIVRTALVREPELLLNSVMTRTT
ncbi:MAG TPA: hypothetical protein PK648_17525 [Verrucomicrobiales bacterium]|nr:hypothetical protein [Verrucomicrobiales bacterium]